MKHLVIKNFGPIDFADLNLGQVNVIIGMQSSGKSCVLKTACFCSWVEKRLELTQGANGFARDNAFIQALASYFNMQGFIKPDTFISYETAHVAFSYANAERKFQFKWKSRRWHYRRHKVGYVPADRNIVAAIPGWSNLAIDNSLLDFMTDWDRARRFVGSEENVLNLGLTYSYNKQSGTDELRLANGKPLTLKESSSGIQSLLPMYVYLDYLSRWQYNDTSTKLSFEQKNEQRNLISAIYKQTVKGSETDRHVAVTFDTTDYYFDTHERAENFRQRCNTFTRIDHSEVYVEEPEDNLFPPTQSQLVNWLLEGVATHNDLLFVATHSPYVLNQFIKNDPKGLQVFFTHSGEGDNAGYHVHQMTRDELNEAYGNGVDLFFDFESYV
jgi:hypothetical protein